MEHSKADVAKLFLERFQAHRASSHQLSMAEAVELLTNAPPPRLPGPIRKAEATAAAAASRTTSVTSFSDSFELSDSGPSAAAAPSPSSSNGNSGEGQPATPTGESAHSLDSDEGGGGGDSEGGGGGESVELSVGDSDESAQSTSDDAGRRVVQRVAEASIDEVRHLSDTKLHLEVAGSWKLLITSTLASSHRHLPTTCSACAIRLEWGSLGNVAGAHVTWVDGILR